MIGLAKKVTLRKQKGKKVTETGNLNDWNIDRA